MALPNDSNLQGVASRQCHNPCDEEFLLKTPNCGLGSILKVIAYGDFAINFYDDSGVDHDYLRSVEGVGFKMHISKPISYRNLEEAILKLAR